MLPEVSPDEFTHLLRSAQPLMAALPRIGTAILVLPFLPPSIVPRRLKAAFTLSMCLVTYPAMSHAFPLIDWAMGEWLLYALKESLIGALVGYAMGMVLWALTTVGELLDIQVGFNNAQIFDPFGGHSAGPLSALMSQLGILLFVSIGGLQVFLQLLYESLVLWPPTSFYPDVGAGLKGWSIATSATVLEFAVRLAAPVLGVLLIVELGVGLINRAAPQLNAFYFSMPIKAVTGLLMLSLLLSHLVDVVHQQFVALRSSLPEMEQSIKAR